MIGDVSEETLFNRVKVAKQVYLWTFTTPDRCTAAEVLKRWRKFQNHKKVRGIRCFRVLEEHPGGHGWHIHFMTVDRYDVRKLRPLAEAAGFGRINVVVIPTAKAQYVIKYLVKALRKSTGRRLWACVGFKGYTANTMIIQDTYWQEVFSGEFNPHMTVGMRRQRGLERIRAAMFKRDPSEKQKTMDNKHHAAVIDRLNKGEAVCVAEYRGTRIDKISFRNKQNPAKMDERVILRHALEMGPGQLQCVEWTPDGTTPDGVAKTITLKKGQLVLVSVKKMISEKGNTEISGELVPLS